MIFGSVGENCQEDSLTVVKISKAVNVQVATRFPPVKRTGQNGRTMTMTTISMTRSVGASFAIL